MADNGTRHPNERLRYQRRLRGWTLDDVADRLHGIASRADGPELGVDAHMVGRWERGVRRPAPRYVAILCQLFGQPADELGLVDEVAPTEQMEDDVERRQFMQYLGVLGGATMLDWDRLGELVRGKIGALAPPLIDDLEALTRHLGRQAESMAPRSLLPVLHNHLTCLTTSLRSTPEASRRRVLALASETAILVGLTSSRLDNRGDARTSWAFALELARAAGDDTLFALTLAMQRDLHSTFGNAGHNGNTARALALLDQAAARLDGASCALVRTFVLAKRAEEHAVSGNVVAAYRDLEGAETSLESRHCKQEGIGIFVHWDSARLAAYRGSCAVALNRPDDAIAALEDARARTSPDLVVQRAAVTADLASAYAQRHDVEGCCAWLAESLDCAESNELQKCVMRVLSARRRLPGALASPEVRSVDERLAAYV